MAILLCFNRVKLKLKKIMEELKKINKEDQLPEKIKEKRRKFNNKRYHTQPNESNFTIYQFQTIQLQTLENKNNESQTTHRDSVKPINFKLKRRPINIKQINFKKDSCSGRKNRK